MTVSDVPVVDVLILGLDGIMGYTLSGPFDVFSSVGACWESVSGERAQVRFKVEIVGTHPGPIRTFNNLTLDCTCQIADVETADLIIVPSISPGGDGAISLPANLLAWLRKQHAQGAVLASICAGSFVLAEAGLLDNRRATTHWAYRDQFSTLYPRVHLQRDALMTDENRLICAGGSASWQYLTCYLLELFGGEDVAHHANRFFLLNGVFDKQTPCIALAANLPENDMIVREVQQWMQAHLQMPDLLAKAVIYSGLPERTFKRRFKLATQQTPVEYIQNIRIEKAKRLLEKRSNTIMDISEKIGYSEESSFRRLFKRKVGVTATEYRRAFARPGAV